MYNRLSGTMTPAQKLELLKKEMIRLATEKETPLTQNRNLEIEQEFSKLRQGILDLGNALSTPEANVAKTPQAKNIVVTPRRIVKKSSANKSPLSVAPAFSPPRFIRRFGETTDQVKTTILTPTARSVMASLEAKKASQIPKQGKVPTFFERKQSSPQIESVVNERSTSFMSENKNKSSNVEIKQVQKRRKTDLETVDQPGSTSFELRKDDYNPFSIHKKSLTNPAVTGEGCSFGQSRNVPSNANKKYNSPKQEVLTPTARAMKARLEEVAEAKKHSPKKISPFKPEIRLSEPNKITIAQSPFLECKSQASEILTPTARAVKASQIAKSPEPSSTKSPENKPVILTPTARDIQAKMMSKNNTTAPSSPISRQDTSNVLTPTARAVKALIEKSATKSPPETKKVEEKKETVKVTKASLSATTSVQVIKEDKQNITITKKDGSPKKVVQYLTSTLKGETCKSELKLTPTARAMLASMEAKRKEASDKLQKSMTITTEKTITTQTDFNDNSKHTSLPDTPTSKPAKLTASHRSDSISKCKRSVRGIIKPTRLTRKALHPERESPRIKPSKGGRVSFGKNITHSDSVEKVSDGEEEPSDSETCSESFTISSRKVNLVSKGKKRLMSSSEEEGDHSSNSSSVALQSGSKRRRTFVTTPHPVKRKRQSLKVTVSTDDDDDDNEDDDDDDDDDNEDDADVSDVSDVVKSVKQSSTRKSSRQVIEKSKNKRPTSNPTLSVTVTEHSEDEEEEIDENVKEEEEKEEEKDSNGSDSEAIKSSEKRTRKKSPTKVVKPKTSNVKVKKNSKSKNNEESIEETDEISEEPVEVRPVKKRSVSSKRKAVDESNDESDITEDSIPATPTRKRQASNQHKSSLSKVEEETNEESEDSVKDTPTKRRRSYYTPRTKLSTVSEDSTAESDDSNRSAPSKRKKTILSTTKVGFSKDGSTMDDIPEDKEVVLTTVQRSVMSSIKTKTVKSKRKSKHSDTEEESDTSLAEESEESTVDLKISKERKSTVAADKKLEQSKQNLTPAARAVLAKMMAAKAEAGESSKKSKKKTLSKESSQDTDATESDVSVSENSQRRSRRRSNFT